jgi:hypothetical protein
MCKFLLRPVLLLAQSSEVPAETFANIRLATVASMSTIDLKTMSDIPLDCGWSCKRNADTDRRHMCLRLCRLLEDAALDPVNHDQPHQQGERRDP